MMPTDIAERSAQAWSMAREAKQSARVAYDSTLDVAQSVGQLAGEQGRLITHIAQLTRVIEELRARFDRAAPADDEERPITFPDLEKILREEKKRDSDRVQAQQLRTIKGWIKKGIGKAVATLVTAAVLVTAGWLARELLGPHARILTHEAVPIIK